MSEADIYSFLTDTFHDVFMRDDLVLKPELTAKDVEGWDSGEVCELLAISEGNQRVLLHRARSKVRAFVEERLGSERPL